MSYHIYEYPITIKESHLDTLGHLNNAMYFQLYEEARWELVTQNGYGIEEVKKTQMGPVILDANIRFLREIRLRERITIHTQTQEYAGKIGVMKQWMTNEAGKICSDVSMKFGLFDTQKRKLVKPTEAWLKAVE